MRACQVLIAVLLFAVPVLAHPVPFSYLDIQLRPGSIEVSLTVHIYDLAHDLQITPMERLLDAGLLAEREDAIEKLLSPRFGVIADNRQVSFEWLEPEILQERQSVRFH